MTKMLKGIQAVAFCSLGILGGCQTANMGGSPAGVPIALETIDGPPAPVKSAFATELADAATSRQVEIAPSTSEARYRVRGYVSTETSIEGEKSVAFVFDVFDKEKRRTRRLTGSSPVQSTSQDPWSGLDREALAKLAAQSMDEIAAFLVASRNLPSETATP